MKSMAAHRNSVRSLLTEEQRLQTKLRTVKTLVIAPSERIDEIASRRVKHLPLPSDSDFPLPDIPESPCLQLVISPD